jgi:hypothetical protein
VRLMLLLLVLTFSCIGAHAQAPQADHIDIGEYGLYTTAASGEVVAPGTTTGATTQLNNIQHLVTTRTVPAQLGVHFGFRYTVAGTPAGDSVRLHMVTIFPSPGLRQPGNPQPQLRSEYDTARAIGSQLYRDYSFEHDWELVPGIWTFQIWYQGRMLAEQKFTVVKQ